MMVRAILNISNFFQLLLQSTISIAKVLLTSNFSLKIPSAQQPVASVLGNGPSLNTSLERDLDFIKSTEIYCVNHFALSAIFTQIKPQNYVLLDPAFFLYSLSNNSREDVANCIESLRNNTSWKMNIFIPKQYKSSFLAESVSQNPQIKLQYFNYTIVKGFKWLRFLLYNTHLGMVQCQNILACTIFMTLKRKHQEVYLFGADHSWHEGIRVSEDNALEMKQEHFYDKPGQAQHQRVFDVVNKKTANLHEQFLSLHKAFYSYTVLAEYAQSLGIKVKNKSVKSYIDAFERV